MSRDLIKNVLTYLALLFLTVACNSNTSIRGLLGGSNSSSMAKISGSAITVTEGENIEFTITLDRAIEKDVYVQWQISSIDSTALLGQDAEALSGVAIILAGSTSVIISIPTFDDTLNESPETLVLLLSSPLNAEIITGEIIGTINDNDAISTLSLSSVGAVEGENLKFRVTVSPVSGSKVTFNWQILAGTATHSDVSLTAGSVVIAPGLSYYDILVPTIDDSNLEGSENLTLQISSVTGANPLSTTSSGIIFDKAPTATRVNQPLTSTGSIKLGRWMPDSQRVVYIGYQTRPKDELFIVNKDGITGKQRLDHGDGFTKHFTISNDGQRIVYSTDERGDSKDELFSVKPDGTSRTILSPSALHTSKVVVSPNQFNANYDDFILTTGNRVVFKGTFDNANVYEYYSGRIDRNEWFKLTPDPVTNGDATTIKYSSASNKLLIQGDLTTDNSSQLYVVSPEGGDFLKLTDNTTVPNSNVLYNDGNGFQFADNGQKAVFIADQNTSNDYEAYIVDIDGNNLIKLSDTLVASGDISSIAVSDNLNKVIYSGDQNIDGTNDLYSIDFDGSAPSRIKLNGIMTGTNLTFKYQSGMSRLVYIAQEDSATEFDIYSVGLDGSNPQKIGDSGTEGSVQSFKISPDGLKLAYFAGDKLFVANVDNTNKVQLPTFNSGEPISPGHLSFNSTSSQIYFIGTDGLFGANEIFAVATDGTGLHRIHPPLSGFKYAGNDFLLSPNDQNMLFNGVITHSNSLLYTNNVDGSNFKRVTDDLPGGGSVHDFLIGEANSRVLYKATVRNAVPDWFMADYDGSNQTEITPPGASSFSNVFEIFLSADGTKITSYGAEAPYKNRFQSISSDGTNHALHHSGGQIHEFSKFKNWHIFPTPDFSQIIYGVSSSNSVSIYCVTPDGSTVTSLSPGALGFGEDGTRNGKVRVSADSNYVVFTQEKNNGWGGLHIYSNTMDGINETRLNNITYTGGSKTVTDFAISPNSSTVVYISNEDDVTKHEIYSVPIAGGAKTNIGGGFVANGTAIITAENYAKPFLITQDSASVVFTADKITMGIDELFSTPIGGGAVVKINGNMDPAGDVKEFKITSNSTTVVYLADQDTDGVIELYTNLLGGGTATKLSGALVSGGNVNKFEITPDNTKVVFLADKDTDGTDELYVVPIGGGAITKLNDPLPPGGNVFDFVVSPNSLKVAYRADQFSSGQINLWGVNIDSTNNYRINGTLTFGNVGTKYKITSDSSKIFFIAPQNIPSASELFWTPF